ncbi:MAG: hypothetical protein ABI729_10640 [Chitinophagales bacterium]
METVIKIRAKEFDNKLFKKIRDFVSDQKNMDITISIGDSSERILNDLDKSIQQLDQKDKLIAFTSKEFLEYSPVRRVK